MTKITFSRIVTLALSNFLSLNAPSLTRVSYSFQILSYSHYIINPPLLREIEIEQIILSVFETWVQTFETTFGCFGFFWHKIASFGWIVFLMNFISNLYSMKIKEQTRKLYLSTVRRSWRGLKRFSKSINYLTPDLSRSKRP